MKCVLRTMLIKLLTARSDRVDAMFYGLVKAENQFNLPGVYTLPLSVPSKESIQKV